MPELPEVETVRLTIEPRVKGRRVVRATLHRRDVLVVPGDPAGGFGRNTRAGRPAPKPKRAGKAHMLEGAVLSGVLRKGKQLALAADDGRRMLVHLGMSGRLFALGAGERVPGPAHLRDHLHASWRLDDGSRVVFCDPRRFGGLRFVPDMGALDALWSELGPDGLGVRGEDLAGALTGRARSVKAVLLDQTLVAGLGNIYVDEACHLAGVDPTRLARTLGGPEIERLASAIRETLRGALERGGSTLRDFADGTGAEGGYQREHRVYGRGGLACLRCGTVLERVVHAGRSTVWCRSCQPAEGRADGSFLTP